MTTQRWRVNRRAALGLMAGPLLAALPGRARGQRLDRLVFLTDWRAQAEHGGFYQAQAAGLYRAAGLEVELRTGGPQINPAQLLIAGRVDMSMGSALESFNFVREGLPFLTVAAIFQKEAQVLIGHPNTGLTGFEALRDRTILVGAQARTTWWPICAPNTACATSRCAPTPSTRSPSWPTAAWCSRAISAASR
jgi:NitT/TauT family transport system substrate-binding protein